MRLFVTLRGALLASPPSCTVASTPSAHERGPAARSRTLFAPSCSSLTQPPGTQVRTSKPQFTPGRAASRAGRRHAPPMRASVWSVGLEHKERLAQAPRTGERLLQSIELRCSGAPGVNDKSAETTAAWQAARRSQHGASDVTKHAYLWRGITIIGSSAALPRDPHRSASTAPRTAINAGRAVQSTTVQYLCGTCSMELEARTKRPGPRSRQCDRS